MKEILKKYNISPNQFYFLSAIFSNTNPYRIHRDEIKELINKGFLISDDSGMYLTDISHDIFGTDRELYKLFNEIWESYPKKTPNGRLLRPLSHDSQIGKKAFQKLKNNLKDVREFNKIIKALKSEINIRIRTNSLNYMKHINTWINQKAWEEYLGEDESEEESAIDIG